MRRSDPTHRPGDTTQPTRHPAVDLDDVVHQRTRLGILAILAAGDNADFNYLKQALELTDGNLNRHLEVLSVAGLISTRRITSPRRRTGVGITASGRAAFARELRYLEMLTESPTADGGQRLD